MLLKCTKCGFENQLGTIYCHGCGEKLEVGEVDNAAMEEEIAIERAAANGSWARTLISWTVFFIVLVIIIWIGSLAFSTSQAPQIKPISEEDAMIVQDTSRLLHQGVGKIELKPKELTLLVKENILVDGCERDYGTYAVRGITFDGKGNELTVYVHTNLANRKVVFSITGLLKKRDNGVSPVDFELKGMKMGELPLWFGGESVYEKFKPTLQCLAVKDLFNAADDVVFKQGKLEITFPGGKNATPIRTTPQKKRKNRGSTR